MLVCVCVCACVCVCVCVCVFEYGCVFKNKTCHECGLEKEGERVYVCLYVSLDQLIHQPNQVRQTSDRFSSGFFFSFFSFHELQCRNKTTTCEAFHKAVVFSFFQ